MRRNDKVPETPEAQEQSANSADEKTSATTRSEIDRLACLDLIDYESARKKSAKALDFRPPILDAAVKQARVELGIETPDAKGQPSAPKKLFEELEPWPNPVNGDELLDDVEGMFRRHVALPEHAAVALALWVLFTYVHDHVRVSPLLALVSATMRCGKTTCLSILAGLCFRVLAASNISPAVLFRAVEKWSPTLLIDEADSFLRDNEALRGVLNSGHTRSTAWVLRCVGDDDEPKRFCTFSPKAIAAIKGIAATLTDRAIIINMRRKRPDELVDRLPVDGQAMFADLRRRCLRWAADNSDLLKNYAPYVPNGLHDRAADNWEPLFGIADVARTADRYEAGTDWARKTRAAAVALSGGDQEEETVGVQLLVDLHDLFKVHGTDRLASADIVEDLGKMEDRPWPEWGRSHKPITTRQVARLLKPFGIAPKSIRVDTDHTPKGYELDQFTDVFSRYLPSLSATTPQTASDAGLCGSPSATPTPSVADRNDGKHAPDKACGAVADQSPPEGEEEGVLTI